MENKTLFGIDGIYAYKKIVFKNEQYCTKKPFEHFISYNNNDVIRTLCIKLPQMFLYVECFDSNETMSFKVSDKKLLKKYTKIWKKHEQFN